MPAARTARHQGVPLECPMGGDGFVVEADETEISPSDFQTYFPQIDTKEAASVIGADGETVSLSYRFGLPDLLVVKFATRKRTVGPVGLNPVVARALLNALAAHVKKLPPEHE